MVQPIVFYRHYDTTDEIEQSRMVPGAQVVTTHGQPRRHPSSVRLARGCYLNRHRGSAPRAIALTSMVGWRGGAERRREVRGRCAGLADDLRRRRLPASRA